MKDRSSHVEQSAQKIKIMCLIKITCTARCPRQVFDHLRMLSLFNMERTKAFLLPLLPPSPQTM